MRRLERRSPDLVVVIPALLLIGLTLVGSALLFRQNFEQPTSAGRWIGSTVFMLCSVVIVAALLRRVVPRVEKVVSQREHHDSSGAMSGPRTARDDMIPSWRFTPRWKEELACASADGEVVLEMMMGEPHVYFPTDEVWARQAPCWAKARRAELLAELEQWCTAQGIPLTVDEQAWVAPR